MFINIKEQIKIDWKTTMNKLLLLFSMSALLSISASAKIVSDGTNVDDWRVYTEATGEITTHDGVLSLSGQGKSTGYRLDIDSSDEANIEMMSWNMKYSEDFTVYIRVRTEEGLRYLIYTPKDVEQGKNGIYIRIGLGSDIIDGKWHRVERSILWDLRRFEPNIHILAVEGFFIRGSGELDAIGINEHESYFPFDPIEDAEDGDTEGWSIYSGDQDSATIRNIYDGDKGSNIIELEGEGKGTGYRFGSGSFYNASSEDFAFCWDMKTDEDFTFYLRMKGPKGSRYLMYTPRDDDRGLSGSSIGIGLGVDSNNGEWQHHCVNPTADIQKYDPDYLVPQANEIIDNIYIRGSMRVDNFVTQHGG